MVAGFPIAVGVPIRNEVERLPILLRALSAQRDAPQFAVALFFDNCVDGSEALVSAASGSVPFRIVTDRCRSGGAANAGLARRRAMALAAGAAPFGTLMTTDADSQPAADWISANVRGLQAADIVAGRIVHEGGDASPIQAQLEAYLDRLHRFRRLLDPVPWEAAFTHHWTSAASLAMSCDMYHAADGFPAIASGEDAAFGDTAARGGYRLRRDASVRVTTSTRRDGRAAAGFAASLSAWDQDAAPPYVAHPQDEAWRYALHGRARRLHRSGSLDGLARDLRLSLTEVETVADQCRNGEAFAARIVGAPPGGMRHVPLPHAELLLAMLEQKRLRGAA